MRNLIFLVVLVLTAIGSYYAGWRNGRATVPAVATAGPPIIRVPEPSPVPSEVSKTLPQSAPAPANTADADVNAIERQPLVLPLANLKRSDIQDTFNQSRGGGTRRHEATDILAPRGTPILALGDGKIQKLFLSKPGGITVYQFNPDATYCFYYAHLDRYAPGLREGLEVKKGDVIGYVGTTGDAPANTPHLHFAVFRLNEAKNWWQGTPVNPYPLLIDLYQRQS